jgi:hypothetical protein
MDHQLQGIRSRGRPRKIWRHQTYDKDIEDDRGFANLMFVAADDDDRNSSYILMKNFGWGTDHPLETQC